MVRYPIGHKQAHHDKKRGFTLLELLLVIAIIASLAGIILMALNPAQRLEEANEVKSLANAKDIEKALNAYVVEHNGQYPTSLQTEFSSGETRVDICVSGQVCNGVDLTTGLISEGYLSSIPVHSSYGTSTDSGYDIVYDASTEAIRIIESPVFLLRDDFTTAQAAPLTSPRTAEPGPGTWTITNPSAIKFSIDSGKFVFPNNGTSWANGFVSLDSYNRNAGRALVASINHSIVYQFIIGWSDNSSIYNAGQTSELEDYFYNHSVSTGVQAYSSGTGIPEGITTYSANSNHKIAVILRSKGSYLIYDNKLIWPLFDSLDSPLYPAVTISSTNVGILDHIRVVDLPYPWNDDYGLATYRKAGNVSVGTQFSHETDGILEYTVTTIPSISGAIRIFFRYIDANNYIQLNVDNGGGMTMYQKLSGVSTVVGSNASGIVPGHRVVVVADGTTIRVYSNNTLRITGTTSITSGTVGNLVTLDASSAISDLITWPRTLSGEAATILDNASL